MQSIQLTVDQQTENFVLDQYAAKKEKGIISLEFDEANSRVVVIHKMKDALEDETEPIKLGYTSSSLENAMLNRRDLRLAFEQELIKAEREVLAKKAALQEFDAATNATYPELKADVLALEEKHQPSNPTPDKNRHHNPDK